MSAAAVFVLAPALALGSFLNVVVARVPERRSILRPPSSCGSCGERILWRDNVPIVSWLLLRGRCRHCAAPISALYPAVEALTAALVVACIAVFGPTAYAALAAGFCAVLVALAAIDVQRRIVPDRIVLPAAVAVLVGRTALDPGLEWALAAIGAGGALFLAVLAYPRGLGHGDVKVALLLGAMLGATAPVALMVGLLAALVPAGVLAARHGIAARKLALPLVPFLAFGAVVALFAGDAILEAYLSLF
ncbi:MAG: type 4 prepilin-like proteins leader peptide-processing enzyme [Gaiellaceae bacterium]|nr:MAG: type 4 prepilin-like proteins leader peptide-processing enzyme [Gaiellaceae bacterium]